MSMNAVALRQAIRNGRNVPEGRLTLAETPLPLRACEEIVSHCSADVLVGRYSGQNPQRLPTWTSALRIVDRRGLLRRHFFTSSQGVNSHQRGERCNLPRNAITPSHSAFCLLSSALKHAGAKRTVGNDKTCR